jgi:hypothetical protein
MLPLQTVCGDRSGALCSACPVRGQVRNGPGSGTGPERIARGDRPGMLTRPLPDRYEPYQKRIRTPNRMTRPTENPSVLPTVSASSTAVAPLSTTPLIK